MTAGSGSFRLGRGSVEISRGVAPPAAPIRDFDLGVANRPECTPGIGYGWQKYQRYCDECSPWARKRNDCFSPRLDCWSLNRDPLRQRSPAPRELVPDTAFTHLQYGARVVLNSCHSLSLRIGWSRVGPMTRILWRRLRQDDGRCQIAGRLAVEGGSHYDRSYDRSAGPALPKVASPPRRLFSAPK
jgi:hypothetical protein